MADRLLENSKALERLSEEVESGFHTLEKSLKKEQYGKQFQTRERKRELYYFCRLLGVKANYEQILNLAFPSVYKELDSKTAKPIFLVEEGLSLLLELKDYELNWTTLLLLQRLFNFESLETDLQIRKGGGEDIGRELGLTYTPIEASRIVNEGNRWMESFNNCNLGTKLKDLLLEPLGFLAFSPFKGGNLALYRFFYLLGLMKKGFDPFLFGVSEEAYTYKKPFSTNLQYGLGYSYHKGRQLDNYVIGMLKLHKRHLTKINERASISMRRQQVVMELGKTWELENWGTELLEEVGFGGRVYLETFTQRYGVSRNKIAKTITNLSRGKVLKIIGEGEPVVLAGEVLRDKFKDKGIKVGGPGKFLQMALLNPEEET